MMILDTYVLYDGTNTQMWMNRTFTGQDLRMRMCPVLLAVRAREISRLLLFGKVQLNKLKQALQLVGWLIYC